MINYCVLHIIIASQLLPLRAVISLVIFLYSFSKSPPSLQAWCIPDVIDFPPGTTGREGKEGSGSDKWALMKLKGLSPYWISRSSATLNDVELQGIFLLTAPNMSGKSTLMRSVLVAALLANCGLFAPCTSAIVPKYDNFFLRTTSHDVPSEKKSAFALEMDDMRIILEDSTARSLIMLDELGESQGP